MTGIDKRILVILDLDETLIHATSRPVDDNWDFQLHQYKVYLRPGLNQFLSKLAQHFRVAVWSSASDDYVDEVVDKIFPKGYQLLFTWGRSKCTLQYTGENLPDSGYMDYYSHLNYVKKLKKVKMQGFSTLEKTLIIDDTPRKSKHNFGNAIYPSEFTGSQDDNELDQLMRYLLTLKDVDNVRTIEKRYWKKKLLEKE